MKLYCKIEQNLLLEIKVIQEKHSKFNNKYTFSRGCLILILVIDFICRCLTLGSLVIYVYYSSFCQYNAQYSFVSATFY